MSKIAFLFPGQGSQYVGMCKDILEAVNSAKEIFQIAEDVTQIPVTKLALEGPLEELTSTRNLQPVLCAADMAICSALRERGIEPDAVAGHSLGEFPALWAAGVLSTKDTFKLVKKRGILMDAAGERVSGSMAAVIGLSKEELSKIIDELRGRGEISLANHNSPEQIVITGERELIRAACKKVKEKGARAIPLKVSGPFHSPLMKDAAKEFSSFIDEIEFLAPKVPIYSNVSAKAETDPIKIKGLLSKQMVSPVRWYDTVINMKNDGIDIFIESGPKKVLSNLIKKCLPEDKSIKIFQVENMDDIDQCNL